MTAASAGTGVTPVDESAIRLTWKTSLYRGATISMFLSGLGFSAAAPQIASFLVNDLGASLTTAGLYYLTNLTAPIAGYLVGSYSDRIGRRLGLFRFCAILGFLGWALIASSTAVWMPFVLSAILLSLTGAASSQLFSALHDDLQQRAGDRSDDVVSIVRMALTAGWIVGPVLGSFLVAVIGFRALLLVTALATLAQIIPLGFRRSTAAVPVPVTIKANIALTGSHRRRRMLPLLTFTGLYVLVYAGEPIKYAYLPIYMRTDLQLPAVISGAVIGIQPLVELVIMPIAALVARRIGLMRLMIIGAAFGVAANCCFAFASGAALLFAGQVLMGGVWGVFAALGIIVAQRLLPEGIATASAIFLSSTAVASALGGLTGGVGADLIGLPLVFLAPAGFALVAATGLLLMATSRHAVN